MEDGGGGAIYSAIELSQVAGGLIDFTTPGEDMRGRIVYTNSSNNMSFFTAALHRVEITGSGNVGIGTASPTYKLDVKGTVNVANSIIVAGSNVVPTLIAAFAQANTANTNAATAQSTAIALVGAAEANAATAQATGVAAYARANTANTNAATANTNAATAQSTATTAQATGVAAFAKANAAVANVSTITIAGSMFIPTALGVGTAASATAGEIRATNEITAYYSDERLKDGVANITNASERLKLIDGVFYYNNELAKSLGFEKPGRQVGVIAQDVESVMPEAVRLAPFDAAPDGSSLSGENYLTVKYELLVPLLIEALKDALLRIEALENKQ
jgi:hypothetical protein